MMAQRIDSRSRTHIIILIVILATIPCYCLGLFLLWGTGKMDGNGVTAATGTLSVEGNIVVPTEAPAISSVSTTTLTLTPTITVTFTHTITYVIPPSETPTPTCTYTPTASETPTPTATFTLSPTST